MKVPCRITSIIFGRTSLEGVTFWTIFGLIANFLFASRFVIQWYVSEKLKRSVIPVQFWYLSIAGSVMMLIYAIYIGKVPLILGFLFPDRSFTSAI